MALKQTGSSQLKSAMVIQNMANQEWENVGKLGLYTKTARVDREGGQFLGLFRFDPDAISGVHRHLDIATTYLLAGSVCDCVGTFRQGDVGINPPGDTHDAFSYEGAVMVSRIEGPTIYPTDELHLEDFKALHPGAYCDEFGVIETYRNKEVQPFAVADLPLTPTGCPGVGLRLIYDYASSEYDFRMSSLYFQAGTRLPTFMTAQKLELFIVAGDINCSAGTAHANHFIQIPAQSKVDIQSNFGCHLISWSEAPVTWLHPNADLYDPFGFS